MAKVVISMDEYEEYKEFKELMDDFSRLINGSECIPFNIGLFGNEEYGKDVIVIDKSDIEELFNKYFGLIDIKIVGE